MLERSLYLPYYGSTHHGNPTVTGVQIERETERDERARTYRIESAYCRAGAGARGGRPGPGAGRRART